MLSPRHRESLISPRSRTFSKNDRAFTSVEEYVQELGGKREISRILIANNGISAVKAIRSIRRWAYEMFSDDHKIQFVTMATPEDLKANAEYIRMADQVVEVPGGSNNNNYANVMLIVEIAERWQVDAVWAGWGHASENPILPDSLAQTDRSIIFIGPPGRPMRALGDKIGSTLIAQSAKVPTIAWNGDGLTVDYAKQGRIPDVVYRQASIDTVADAIAAANRIGYPVMIKASEGGGGKGIRKVHSEDGVATAFTAVQGEIPGSPIFIMKLAPKSRHLEVQLLADEYGEAISLSGRDCSIQRRHQKIVEEGPVTAPPPDVWKKMERAATRLAKEVQYVNAGTVEYLYTEEAVTDDADDRFFFLELNPRLQVEHPVTEMITGVNLPAAQLQVAMGIPLHRIPDVRKLYNKSPFGASPIDFDLDEQSPPHGHVIAARITAENPDAGFQPTSGAIEELNFRSTPDVWGYFSVDSSGRVHEFADSQIGHLFAWGLTRDKARKNMIVALKELSIRGDIRTTVEYIIQMMESNDFSSNKISTSWLDERIARHAEVAEENKRDPLLVVIAGALCSAHDSANRRIAEYASQLSRGQLPSSDLLVQRDNIELIYDGVKYILRVDQSGPMTFTITCNGSYVQADVRTLSDGGYLLIINGKSHVAYCTKESSGLRLVLDGTTSLFTQEYDPTRIKTNAAGKLARFLVADGSKVRRGVPFAEIEVMKMYMPILTTEAGVISFQKQEGSVLSPGDLIATMELEDPSCVEKSVEYSDQLPDFSKSNLASSKAGYRLKNALKILETVLDGYLVPPDVVNTAIQDLVTALQEATLPCDELKEELSKISGRIASVLYQEIAGCIRTYETSIVEGNKKAFNIKKVEDLINDYVDDIEDITDKASFEATIAPLRRVIDNYREGLLTRHVSMMKLLSTKYFAVEATFARGKRLEDTIMELRCEYHDDPIAVFSIARSHVALRRKNDLILKLLKDIQRASRSADSPDGQLSENDARRGIDSYVEILDSIAGLKQKAYSLVALEARHLLLDQKIAPCERLVLVDETIQKMMEAPDDKVRQEVSSNLLDVSQPIFDLLISKLSDPQQRVRECALELYVRRIYRSYRMEQLATGVSSSKSYSFANFQFRSGQEDALSVGMAAAESYDDLSSLNRSSSSLKRESSFGGTASDSDTGDAAGGISEQTLRHGILASFSSLDDLFENFDIILEDFARITGTSFQLHEYTKSAEAIHVMHFAIQAEQKDEETIIDSVTKFLAKRAPELTEALVRRVTFAVRQDKNDPSEQYRFPGIFTFRQRLNYQEDPIVRHIEAPLAYTLELKRLSNYNVRCLTSGNKNVHLYVGSPKRRALLRAKIDGPLKKRIFVRAVVRQTDRIDDETKLDSVYDAYPGPERMFVDALNALDLAIGQQESSGASQFGNNHVFLSVLPEAVVDPQYIEAVIRILASRYGKMLRRLNVTQVEFRINARFTPESPKIPVRLIACNPTGFVLRVESYVEARESNSASGSAIFTSIGDDGQGDLEGMPVTTPYPVAHVFDRHRELATKMSDTLFVYDFLELFEHALVRIWRRHLRTRTASRNQAAPQQAVPRKVMESVELVWDEDRLIQTTRPMGQNDIGMVAWLLTLYTPEYPEDMGGRQIVVLANDITHKAGSFGTREDQLFQAASAFARERGCPRIYLAANAGARIGMAESIKEKYRVAWVDPNDPTRGFKYLYLSKQDYTELSAKGAVIASLITEDGEERYVLQDIIGEEKDIGVENLRGSGGIAGETCRAFNEIFTLTYVCGRSVGIGAYLVRLGQRTIQKETNAPIILTGYQALNKLMGKDVYASNDQLGGVKIMHTNGVSHHVVGNHIDGIGSILTWLSFVPAIRNGALPVTDITGIDIIERDVDFLPTKTPYDPRHLLTGCLDERTGTWKSGFADRNSFVESLAGWAKAVVVGRARLGGIPFGVILTEVRTAEKIIPADPAAPKTQENLVQQAGQVWFPDSAHKTATAIRDFKGEDLPLMIFANWRGFSGGQRDMFDEVLKFGAAIVDGLVAYTQPVFVYIPPHAELRGGAWVVVDSTINSDVMEMYADTEGRGGVLEPAGLIEIKYRKRDLIKTAHRLDPKLQQLDNELEQATGDADIAKIESQIEAREKQLLGTYTQIATQFADLHDTPGRMKAKNCIRQIVPWKRARSYFYWRLRRRLVEFDVRRRILTASGQKNLTDAEDILASWFDDAVHAGKTRQSHITTGSPSLQDLWLDDRLVVSWMADERETINRNVSALNVERITRAVMFLGLQDAKGAVQGILELIHKLDDKEREDALALLRRGSIFARGTNAGSNSLSKFTF